MFRMVILNDSCQNNLLKISESPTRVKKLPCCKDLACELATPDILNDSGQDRPFEK